MTTRAPRRSGGSPTIGDVARAAGVSPMTVSRVINGGAGVRAETREAVEAAAARLRYRPNAAARSLAGADRIRIGLLYGNPSAGFLGELLVGCLEQASHLDVQLVLERFGSDDGGRAATDRLIGAGVRGVILPPAIAEASAVSDALASADLPAVVVAATVSTPRTTAVRIDDRAAAWTMTRHLLALGHRRIGFVAGDPAVTASGERRLGYLDALADAGVASDDRLVAPGAFTYRSGLDAGEALLSLAERPTAIFASNDEMAAACVAVAHRRGLTVPADVSVCGFDDTGLATATWPALTTIRQPVAAMARAAVERLVATIRGRELPGDRERLLAFELIHRDSAGPPPPL